MGASNQITPRPWPRVATRSVWPSPFTSAGWMFVAPGWLSAINRFVQGLAGSGGALPPGEPFAASAFGLRPTLGSERYVLAAVSIHIAHAKIVTEAGCVFVGKNKAVPARAARGDLGARATLPSSGREHAAGRVGDEVGFSVAVDVALQKSVDAVHLVIHVAASKDVSPAASQAAPARRSIPAGTATDPVEIAVAIDVEELAHE